MLQEQHSFWCPECWELHFWASRIQVYLERGTPSRPSLVVTAIYYTFSGRLQLINVIETPASNDISRDQKRHKKIDKESTSQTWFATHTSILLGKGKADTTERRK